MTNITNCSREFHKSKKINIIKLRIKLRIRKKPFRINRREGFFIINTLI